MKNKVKAFLGTLPLIFSLHVNAADIEEQEAQEKGGNFVPTKQIDLYPSKVIYQDYMNGGIPLNNDPADIRWFIKDGEVEALNKDYIVSSEPKSTKPNTPYAPQHEI